MVDSGDGLMFSLEMDQMFVEGYITRNKSDGLVY